MSEVRLGQLTLSEDKISEDTDPVDNTLLNEDFSEFKDFLTDITLIVGDKRLYVSKVVLASASPVFLRMFQSEFKKKEASEINLPKKEYEDVLKFLQCIYPNMCKPITDDNVYAVIPLAHEYQVDSLLQRCETFLVEKCNRDDRSTLGGGFFSRGSLSNQEVVNLLVLSEKYQLQKLLDAVVDIAYNIHSKQLLSIQEYSDISLETRYYKIAINRLKLLEK